MRLRLRLHAKTRKTVLLKTHIFFILTDVTYSRLYTVITVMQINLSRIKTSVSLNYEHFLYYKDKT